MTRKLLTTAILTLLLSFGTISPAGAGDQAQKQFDTDMQPILEQYLKITTALAADTTQGVSDAAEKIEGLAAKLDATHIAKAHAGHYGSMTKNIPTAAKSLAAAQDMEAARKALAELSKPMVLWMTHRDPKPINIVYCSMFPGSWLQKGKTIHNPFYGAEMQDCGQIVAGPDVKTEDKQQDEHKGH